MIRDFASPEEQQKTALEPIPEIFDPYYSLAEFEYNLLHSRSFRLPIPGKTLHHLLDMGWVTEEEVRKRCAPMDIMALERYNKMIEANGRIYPWRALKWDTVPTLQDRKMLVAKYLWQFLAADRIKEHLQEIEHMENMARKQAEEEEKLVRRILHRCEWEAKEQVGGDPLQSASRD